MVFQGVTTELPAKAVTGDIYKIGREFTLLAANNAENNADNITLKVGDSIVYDKDNKWYYIPSGDDIENTWRPLHHWGKDQKGLPVKIDIPANNEVVFDGKNGIIISSTNSPDNITTIEIKAPEVDPE
jgi:hypothetical protein